MRTSPYNFPLQLIIRGFAALGNPNWAIVRLIIGVGALQVAVVALASYVDGTWWLDGVGDGLLEHYGVWAILVTDPLLLISAAFAYRRFRLSYS